jgi:hypothetical protein
VPRLNKVSNILKMLLFSYLLSETDTQQRPAIEELPPDVESGTDDEAQLTPSTEQSGWNGTPTDEMSTGEEADGDNARFITHMSLPISNTEQPPPTGQQSTHADVPVTKPNIDIGAIGDNPRITVNLPRLTPKVEQPIPGGEQGRPSDTPTNDIETSETTKDVPTITGNLQPSSSDPEHDQGRTAEMLRSIPLPFTCDGCLDPDCDEMNK